LNYNSVMKKILLSVFGLVLLSSASIVAAIPENASYLKSAKDGWTCKGTNIKNFNNCYGTQTFPDGRIYSGEFQDGKAFGFGTLALGDRDGTGVFKGEFINGKPLEGTLYNNDVALWRGTLDENFNGWGYWTYGGKFGITVGRLENGKFASGVKIGEDGSASYYVPINATETFPKTSFILNGVEEWIGFECNSGYQKVGTFFCREIIKDGFWSEDGLVVNCNPGYEKDSLRNCISLTAIKDNKDIEIPPNSIPYDDSWKCIKGYFKENGNSCTRLPSNAYALIDGGWRCNYGYFPKGNSCIKESINETQKPKTQTAEPNKVPNEKVFSAASGSGFSVTSDGYVITNYHVIKGCTDVYIHDKGKSILSTIVTFDPNNDIALLKGKFKPRRFYPLSRESTKLLTEVYVAGHPFGRDISTSVKVTRGIVSSLTGVANNFSNLQIDAALQPGNSGGPIMNDKGNVIGVAVAKLDLDTIVDEYGVVPENVNFGVKANVVINIMESENIKLPKPNLETLPMSDLSEMITDGTYYLSCWMTMAQINKMRETKVIFKSLE
jgi:S1-C subfamily serine protease